MRVVYCLHILQSFPLWQFNKHAKFTSHNHRQVRTSSQTNIHWVQRTAIEIQQRSRLFYDSITNLARQYALKSSGFILAYHQQNNNIVIILNYKYLKDITYEQRLIIASINHKIHTLCMYSKMLCFITFNFILYINIPASMALKGLITVVLTISSVTRAH